MRLPNGYGSVYKLSGKRRKPFIVKKTLGYHVNHETGKSVRDDIIIGYTETKAEGLQMLANYNDNPYDVKTSKMTFKDLYEEWSNALSKQLLKQLFHLTELHLMHVRLCTIKYLSISKLKIFNTSSTQPIKTTLL